MARPPIFEWHGKEYASEEKSADWYWAIGIGAIAIIIACVLFNNFLLATPSHPSIYYYRKRNQYRYAFL